MAHARKRLQMWRHATTWMNYVTIAMEGIQVEACDPRATRRAIWLHQPSKTAWAIIHTQARHHVPLEEVMVLEVAIDRRSVKRHGSGLWYVEEDIPASAIRGVYQGMAIAERTLVDT